MPWKSIAGNCSSLNFARVADSLFDIPYHSMEHRVWFFWVSMRRFGHSSNTPDLAVYNIRREKILPTISTDTKVFRIGSFANYFYWQNHEPSWEKHKKGFLEEQRWKNPQKTFEGVIGHSRNNTKQNISLVEISTMFFCIPKSQYIK